MSFEELLLNYWASCTLLDDAIPFSNVLAGPEVEVEMPFVRVFQNERKAACPTTAVRSPMSFTFRLELHHDSYSAATELLQRLTDNLNGVRIATESDGTFIIRYTAYLHKRLDETRWALTAVFRCMVG